MHSTAITVESMSATSSLRRRDDSPWTMTSTSSSSPSSAVRAADGPIERSRSQALSSSIQLRPNGWTPAWRSASSACEISPLDRRSFAISVAMNKPSASGSTLALIAGPTASGKSALALALAERTGGVLINADSAQVYSDLRIISARPTAADEARAPHRLYGYRDAASPCSAAEWAEDAKRAIAEARSESGLPILCGGTGLYIRTLLDGIAPVPEIDPAIREAVRSFSVMHNHAALEREDPAAAARLR